MKRKLNPKPKEMIQDAVDIVLNTEDDKAAVAFLKDTLVDDYPDLDLGSMDLHEASKVLDKEGEHNETVNPEDLLKAVEEFMKSRDNKENTKKKRNKRTRKKKK